MQFASPAEPSLRQTDPYRGKRRAGERGSLANVSGKVLWRDVLRLGKRPGAGDPVKRAKCPLGGAPQLACLDLTSRLAGCRFAIFLGIFREKTRCRANPSGVPFAGTCRLFVQACPQNA
jgi:hypothetical protein